MRTLSDGDDIATEGPEDQPGMLVKPPAMGARVLQGAAAGRGKVSTENMIDAYGTPIEEMLCSSQAKVQFGFNIPYHAKESAISTKVFVGNLNFRTTEQQLSEALSAAGQVKNVHIGTDRETGRSRGFAFVEFSNETEAAEAIKQFDGHEIDGRKLRVNTAEDRPRRTDGPRGFAPPSGGRPEYRGNFPSAPPDTWSDFGGQGLGGGKPFKNKGSRRGLRARKRSLSF
jgi:hypothetical protein